MSNQLRTRHQSVIALAIISLVFLFAAATQAATFHVTTTADNGDNNNPTPGSLRKAIIDANANVDTDTIDFNITGSGAQTISPPIALPVITASVVIDGYTQPGASKNTLAVGDNAALLVELNGVNAGGSADGLVIQSGVANCLIRGLVINRFQNTAITIGLGKGNNVIEGNFIGIDAGGTVALDNGNGQGTGGILVLGANNIIGGTTPQARNIISGMNTFSSAGVEVRNTSATGNIIEGNYIGTDKSGLVKLGNSFGVLLNGCPSNTVGGTSIGARNLISGNRGGILIALGANKNQVQGNYIGTDASGGFAVGNNTGVIIQQSSVNNIIGGPAIGSSNVIAANNYGALVVDTSKNNSIQGNSIYGNKNLGIDLGADGVTANDQGDGDTGPNNLQNFPAITSAVNNGGNTTIQGALNSTPNTQFNIEFFANPQPDPTGYGQGQTFLGSVNATTNASGDADFSAVFTTAQPGQFISATATDSAGNTSEFSACAYVTTPSAGAISVSSATYSVAENGGAFIVNVSRNGGSAGAVSVNYATSDGAAKAGLDYTAVSGTLNWANGDSSTKQVSIPIIDDAIYEGSEIFNFNLSYGTGGAALGSPSSAFISIIDNETPPSISIADVSKAEGNSAATPFAFTVSLTNASSKSVTVSYATADGTAKAGSDYQQQSGAFTFNPGETSRTVTINVLGDTQFEPDETFFINLSNPVNATIAKGQGAGTILNDDAAQPGTLSFTVSSYSVNENSLQANILVKRTGGSNGAVSVQYATGSGGAATAGSDYTATSGVLNWPDGDSGNKVFSVAILDDQINEPDETVNLSLSNPTGGATIGSPGTAVLTIKDNDPLPQTANVQLEQPSYSVSEGDHFKLINVTRTGDTTTDVSVDYATSDGTAQQRADYNLLLGTLHFAPGETSKTLTFLVTEDSYVEGNETLTLSLSNAMGATLGSQSQAQITILDDDSNQNAPNAITDTQNFVRQQYHDFLNREPDAAGFAGWQDILNKCAPGDASCDRIEVSSAFYRSQEFHDRGYFIYRFYSASLGRTPKYQEFMRDMQKVSGFLSVQQQEQAKLDFINEFMARTEFQQKYGQINGNGNFADAVLNTAGVTLPQGDPLVAQLANNQLTRGQILRLIIESPQVDQKFYNEAFVVMQYFGYLRRDPDILYQQWIQTFNQTHDYRVPVNGFMNSLEYVLRFGQ